MSSEVLSTSSNNISRLDRDNSTIGVGNETSISKTVHSNRVDNSSSSSMGNLSSVDIRGVSRDNSSVSVGYQAMGESNSSIWVISIACGDELSEVSSLGKGNSGGVSGHHGAIGVGHQSSGGDS